MSNTLIGDDRIDAMIALAKTVPDQGFMAECGVYKGGSLLRIAKAFPGRTILGFDTFTGLPKEQWNEQEVHQPGDFNDTSMGAVHDYLYAQNDCVNVFLIEGVFPGSTLKVNQNAFYSFVHVDFDFYEGVKAALEFFWPRLLSGGIMVFDDFDWPACPGVRRALEEFGEPFEQSALYQAYIKKPK